LRSSRKETTVDSPKDDMWRNARGGEPFTIHLIRAVFGGVKGDLKQRRPVEESLSNVAKQREKRTKKCPLFPQYGAAINRSSQKARKPPPQKRKEAKARPFDRIANQQRRKKNLVDNPAMAILGQPVERSRF